MCATLTQVPIRDSIIIIIQFIILIIFFFNPITLMLLGNCAGAVEAWSDVLLVVRNGFVFLNVPLTVNIWTIHIWIKLNGDWALCYNCIWYNSDGFSYLQMFVHK